MPERPLATPGAAHWLGGLLIVLFPSAAQAHLDGSDTGLFNGLMHPVFGLDHLLAMISVGVVSAQLRGNNIWRIPTAFVCAMTIGGTLGIWHLTLQGIELGIAASVLALGIGIVLAHGHMSPWPITGLVLLFGACHGYAHGLEIPKSVSPALYTLGFMISTSVLHILGVVIGEVANMQKWLWTGLRFTGGVVAAAGLVFLLQTLGPPV
jgi:urease accessory protein